MARHVELYEALKPHVGPEAAQMIADVVPPAGDLATRADLQAVRSDLGAEIQAVRSDLGAEIQAVRSDLEAQGHVLRGEIHASEARMAHRMMAYFIPLWVMMGSMALAIVGLVAMRL